MQTRILTIEEIREVYEKYLYYDFPDDERKPLSSRSGKGGTCVQVLLPKTEDSSPMLSSCSKKMYVF